MTKAAIVTGATGDLGRAISLRLAQDGFQLLVHYHSRQEACQALCDEIKAQGGQALAIGGDMRQEDTAQALVDACLEAYGRVDVLVNNAGMTKDNLILRMSDDDFDQVIATNLTGPWRLQKAVIRPMMKQKGGRIINISSVVGVAGNAGQSNYAASKAGLIGITKSLAKEWGSRNITVNAIAPGFIQSDMTKDLAPEWQETIKKQIALGRFGQAEDVAGLVAFLAGPDASYISGQVIRVDGALSL